MRVLVQRCLALFSVVLAASLVAGGCSPSPTTSQSNGAKISPARQAPWTDPTHTFSVRWTEGSSDVTTTEVQPGP